MTSEAVVQQAIRVDAANHGVQLWRNNSGATMDETGRMVRFGLGNDSAQLNKRFKSSDLIGVTSVLVTQEMVGTVVGVFTAVEVKHSEWLAGKKLDDRETAQLAFISHVINRGGFAGFAPSVDAFRRITRKV